MVHLDDDDPYIDLPPHLAKNKRGQIQYLRPDLVAMLRAIMPNDCRSVDRVFVGLMPRVGLDWFRKDLAKAGIAFEDEQGQRCDMHALRHTSATWAGRSGKSLKTVADHLNHKTLTQTARYMHTSQREARELVDGMPSFGGTEIGTDATVLNGQNKSKHVTNSHTLVSPENAAFSMKNAISAMETASLVEVPPRGVEPLYAD
ncbi:MAG: tyrosine-type recombinase/integrase [Phycisphaerales bacterium]